MLYLLDKYLTEYPNKNYKKMYGLNAFENTEKNLHEMTLDEINAVAAQMNPMTVETAKARKREVKNYLKWLQENGIKADYYISEGIEFPIESGAKYLIYNASDIHYYYSKFFGQIERLNAKGNNYSRSTFLMSYASGILAYYGLTVEQIIDLDLSDVQPEGVLGYDLPLDKEDIDILLEYKGLTQAANRAMLVGTKYIRTTVKTDTETIDANFLFQPVSRVQVEGDFAPVKSLLSISNLYMLGAFNRIYAYEKQTGKQIRANVSSFNYFYEQLGLHNAGWSAVATAKKKYIAYRTERDSAAPKETPKEMPMKPVVSEPKAKIPVVTVQTENNQLVTAQLEDLKKQLESALAIVNDLIKNKK